MHAEAGRVRQACVAESAHECLRGHGVLIHGVVAVGADVDRVGRAAVRTCVYVYVYCVTSDK